jgi:hypothetical protein
MASDCGAGASETISTMVTGSGGAGTGASHPDRQSPATAAWAVREAALPFHPSPPAVAESGLTFRRRPSA